MSDRDLKLNIENNKNNKAEKKESKELKIFLISIIIAMVSALITYVFVRIKYSNTLIPNFDFNQMIMQGDLPEGATSDEAYDYLLMNLRQIRKKIDSEYIGEINENDLVQEAIKGYVRGLKDEFTEYYTPEEWAGYKESLEGEFCGIGVYMMQNEDKNTVIVSTIKGTPAAKAGLKEGDIVYKVNGEDVLGIDIDLVSKKIKGPEGTKVKLSFIRDGKEMEKEITREKIVIVNVSSKMIDKTIGYIKVDAFDGHVSEDFRKHYNSLNKKGMKKLILDLRNNTGGDVNQTIKILEMFLPKKSVFYYTKDSKGNENAEYAVDDEEINIPIVILGNKYTASASEIVIASLKEYKNIKFVGENTFGKGVIQTIFQTSNGAALKVTTAEYFKPNKEKIHKIGIKPDIEVKIDEKKKDKKGKIVDSQLNRAIKELKK